MLHAVIMAGGTGTRFWPASRASLPKQLLNLSGDRTLLQATVDRLEGLVPPERVFVVTNERLVDAIREQLPELPAAGVLGEPAKRDTAPCIGWAALQLNRHDPEATMVVTPADHVISPAEKFRAAIAQAAALVDASPRRIVTFGIRPTYPAESFGYIERAGALKTAAGEAPAYRVEQFREKPDAETAAEYLASGKFYWNSGIFVWRARTIMDELAKRQPEMYAHLEKIAAAAGTPEAGDVLRREFTAIGGTSIDYAVMEHAEDVVVIEAPYEWDDIGSWQALARLLGTDADGNTIAAKNVAIRTTGSIVRAEGDHLIATIGLEDCIIVHTPDATLVANKNDEEAIRELVKLIDDRGWQEYL